MRAGQPHSEETKRKMSEAHKKRYEDPEERRKTGEELKKCYKVHPEERKKRSDATKKRYEDPEERRKTGEDSKKMWENPERHRKMSERLRGENNHNFGKSPSEETRRQISETLIGTHHSEETLKIMSEAQKKHYKDHPERRTKASENFKKLWEDSEHRRKISERRRDGDWYGAVTYPAIYCELWKPELRNRIRTYWNHKSVLSGKTKEENNNHLLSCHHVYYQKKACCIWDEDEQGYYAWIDRKKYYINGDPNKFVPLTRAENTKVNSNKLYWIKFFEDLIEAQGGKCFFTKEEMKDYQS